MKRNYVAAFQQAGDFSVVPVNGKMVKNGGNVVSYFCTPEGRLIHAVGGPVSPQKLLAEARWATEAFRQLRMDQRRRKAEVLREAHQIAANPKPSNSMQTNRNQPSSSWGKRPWAGSISQTDPQGHRLIAQYAYLPMAQVEAKLFRTLTGETFELDRTAVLEAAKLFEVAKTRSRPVLLVLESDQRPKMAGNNPPQPGTIEFYFKKFQARRLLGKFTVVQVPKIQLAAFTNLRELSGWDKINVSVADRNWRNQDTCLFVSPSGEIISKLDLAESQFATQLKSALATWEQRSSDKVAAKNQTKL